MNIFSIKTKGAGQFHQLDISSMHKNHVVLRERKLRGWRKRMLVILGDP
jgi:hypothetical protein